MNENFSFEIIEDDTKEENLNEEEMIQDAFVTGLPDWDLEPPFEMLNRGKKE